MWEWLQAGVFPQLLTLVLKMYCRCVTLLSPAASKLDHSLWIAAGSPSSQRLHVITEPAYTERGRFAAFLFVSRACVHSWSTRGRRSGWGMWSCDGQVMIM